MRLGTAITQMSARQPAATAMAAMTMDHLSGGRFVLGLGVSGPAGRRGLVRHAVRQAAGPHARVHRRSCATSGRATGPVTNDGPHYPLPYPGDDATGLGKPLKSSIHPLREDIPIFLGAEGPKNIALAAELCDGWLAMLFTPGYEDFYREALAEGFAREGARRTLRGLRGRRRPCRSSSPTTSTRRSTCCARSTPCTSAAWAPRARTSTPNVAIRMGYEAMVDEVQELYLSGKKDEAGAAIPAELIEKLSLRRPAGQDPPRPRRLARVDRHDAADQRRRRDGAPGRRDRPRLDRAGTWSRRRARGR